MGFAEDISPAAASVAQVLHARGSATISQLVERLDSSRPTVKAALDALIQRGVVDELEENVATSGRPASKYRLVAGSMLTLGVWLMDNRIGFSLAGLDGAVLRVHTGTLDSTLSREARFERVVKAANEFLQGDEPELVSVAVTGVVDGGVVSRSEMVPQWANFPLKKRLEDVFNCDVLVNNNLNLVALAEYSARPGGADSGLLYVDIGQAVNTGLVIDGRIHEGVGGSAGEIADFLGAELNAHAGQADALTRTRRIALSIGAVCAVVRPECVVLGAADLVDGEQVEEVKRELTRMHRNGAPSIPIVGNAFGAEAALVGATVLGVEQLVQRLFGAPAVVRLKPESVSTVRAAFPSVALSGPVGSQRRLRVAVIGAGARSSFALEVERAELNAQIVLVCDPHPLAKQRVRQQLGRDIPVVKTIAEVVDADIDCAFVLTPDFTHAEVSIALLEAGVAVYLEKPMAISVEDATRILDVAYRTGTRLYVGHNMRHMAVVRAMRDVVTSGVIGDIKAIWCRHFVGNGGDYYFKDWHADRSKSNSLLLQKGAHDIDVMHWLGGSYTKVVTAMGQQSLYSQIEDRADRSDQLMGEFFSLENWPPLSQKGLNEIVDVEDLYMVNMRFNNDVLASYVQCHYTPDYWRNYTVIGTDGRLENFGDSDGGVVKVWTRRTTYSAKADLEIPIVGDERGHNDADRKKVAEFINFIRGRASIDANPINAWNAVAVGDLATQSLRNNSELKTVPELPEKLLQYYANNQAISPMR
ncbi:ROK family protein [Gleimia hominis]|uniref:ROK family protein n=1 Tax=Gleimia hominis TaxID=595468 RepID=UPI000C7F9702